MDKLSHNSFAITVNMVSPMEEYYYSSFENALLAIESGDYENSNFEMFCYLVYQKVSFSFSPP